jgi:hypothetical protein
MTFDPAKYGLVPLPAPKTAPTPITDVDVNALTNDELTALYVSHVGYASYIAAVTATAETGLAEATNARDYFVAKERIRYAEEGVADDEILPTIKSTAEYLELNQTVVSRKTEWTMLKAYYKNYRSQAAALSRVASIRSIDIDQARNLNHRRRPNRTSLARPPLGGSSADPDEDDDDDDDDDELELDLG